MAKRLSIPTLALRVVAVADLVEVAADTVHLDLLVKVTPMAIAATVAEAPLIKDHLHHMEEIVTLEIAVVTTLVVMVTPMVTVKVDTRGASKSTALHVAVMAK